MTTLFERLSVPNHPATRGDREIARRLQDLFEDELSFAEVQGMQFMVHAGTVILRGDLRDPVDRFTVSELVQAIPGVVRVVDRMTGRVAA